MTDDQFESAVAQAIKDGNSAAASAAHSRAEEDSGVTIEPYVPAAPVRQSVEDTQRAPEAAMPKPYVPSGAERPQLQRRIPRAEDMPPVARAQMEQPRGEEPRNARALFRRLASNVGLNLGTEPEPEVSHERVQPQFDDAAARSAIEAASPRPAAPRHHPAEGAVGQLDAHGRAPARQPQKDQLEIPAFLKRHG